MAEFADHALLRVQAGHGGNGCASVHREKFKPLGGPDGGNGGRGGSVILEVDPSSSTLLDFHRRPVRKADNGRQGEGSNRNGAAGEDLIIKVPTGTVVLTSDGEVLVDLGLVGFPNAGKSSLIAAMSAARPKIADYPFTTLIPNLGVVEAGDVQFVVADVPGLIPGASQGKGLGHDFLRHVERCSILIHVLDCATEEPGRSPMADLAAIEGELAAYGEATGVDLVSRPRLIALNKIDVPAARERADQVKPELEARGYQVFEISAATGEGMRALGFAMAALVAAERAARPAEEAARLELRPRVAIKARDDAGFEIIKNEDGSFFIAGE